MWIACRSALCAGLLAVAMSGCDGASKSGSVEADPADSAGFSKLLKIDKEIAAELKIAELQKTSRSESRLRKVVS
jgi:hypothetical protein